MAGRYLSYVDLKQKGIAFSRPHLRDLERAGKFPRRIKLGANKVVWDEAEIDLFLQQRTAAREPAAIEPSRRRSAG